MRFTEMVTRNIAFSGVPTYSLVMVELDEMWADLLLATSIKAGATGRGELAKYLRLKIENDKIRQIGVDWLIKTFIDLAVQRSLTDPGMQIDRVAPHAFQNETSNMVGSLIRVQRGVRCLSLEAGWVRTPSDGIMRRGSLAVAQVIHFGMSGRNSSYKLVRSKPSPVWIDESDTPVQINDIDQHFEIFFSS